MDTSPFTSNLDFDRPILDQTVPEYVESHADVKDNVPPAVRARRVYLQLLLDAGSQEESRRVVLDTLQRHSHPNWILMFLQSWCEARTVVLALRVLSVLLTDRGATTSFAGKFRAASGFLVLGELLQHHIHIGEVHLLVTAILLGREHVRVQDGTAFTYDNLQSTFYPRDVKSVQIVNPEAAIVCFHMLGACFRNVWTRETGGCGSDPGDISIQPEQGVDDGFEVVSIVASRPLTTSTEPTEDSKSPTPTEEHPDLEARCLESTAESVPEDVAPRNPFEPENPFETKAAEQPPPPSENPFASDLASEAAGNPFESTPVRSAASPDAGNPFGIPEQSPVPENPFEKSPVTSDNPFGELAPSPVPSDNPFEVPPTAASLVEAGESDTSDPFNLSRPMPPAVMWDVQAADAILQHMTLLYQRSDSFAVEVCLQPVAMEPLVGLGSCCLIMVLCSSDMVVECFFPPR
jgi:hypothetical protein